MDKILFDEPMSLHTTFKTGGNADVYVKPQSGEALVKIIQTARAFEIPCFVIGNASNLIVSDRGIRGVVVSTLGLRGCELLDGLSVRVNAGASLASVAAFCADNNLAGFEFASGIPGTFGGAVYMNAGAYDSEMSKVVKSITALDETGNIAEYENGALTFGYRTSVLQKRKLILLSGVIGLNPGIRSKIKAKMADFNARRTEKQPLEYPSAGSVFKRPDNNFAGKLIMEAGLAGCSIGGAQVSSKHCGFIINKGNASTDDIVRLIRHIRETVYKIHGVSLETEVKFIGEQ